MSKFRLRCRPDKDLPKLAWLASIDQDRRTITVIHGLSVECRDEWIVEGVWDDNFELGNFHQTENFFGSGLRIDGDCIYCVPSSALVDRLMYCEADNVILVSNSLIVLLAATGAALDNTHDYHRETLSILKGIEKYDKEFSVTHPRIKYFYQVFYENMVVSSKGISFQKRRRPGKINSFKEYHDLIKEVLVRVKHNYESKARENIVHPFTTISAGYDSTAVACLAKELEVNCCFTGNVLDRPIPLRFIKRVSEDGSLPAKALGFNTRYLDTRRASVSEDELYFLSTNYPKFASSMHESIVLDGVLMRPISRFSELSLLSMAGYIEESCSVAVVFTGYHGDIVWDVNSAPKHLTDDILRQDISGLNLTEIRLKAGFFNVAVPFIAATRVTDIAKISRSSEMKPWRLNNSYDRPIPRRIVESSGVDRKYFGMRKDGLAAMYRWPVNKSLRKQFFKHLKENYRFGSVFVYFHYMLNYVVLQLHVALKRFGLSSSKNRNIYFWRRLDFYYLMNHWAVGVLTRKMSDSLRKWHIEP